MSSNDVDGPGRGIDVAARHGDIKRIVAAWLREPKTQSWLKAKRAEGKAARRIELDDLVQDVILLVLRRQNTASAYDPSRASLSKYVRLCAFTAVTHAVDRTDLEQTLDDPARWGSFSACNDNLSEGVRAIVSAREGEFLSLAREIERDAASGQIRMFAPEQEYPELSEAAE
ncbi:MAG: hypothetical protein U0441_14825 [Polyangiaceae bacterium]